MPIEGFDYKAFATDLSKQALEVLMQPGTNAAPSTLSDAEKKEIVETVKNFCAMAGEALSNDPQIKFNAEQASIITQFIGEWTFHKSIDLIKGQIPQPNRGPILQVIAANIFSTAKLAIIKNLPQDSLINLVEEKVKQIYAQEIDKLVEKGILTKQQRDVALNASNLNDMVEKAEEQARKQQVQQSSGADKKTLKLAALAVVLKKLPEQKANQILNSLDQADVQNVVNYMRMSNLEDKIDRQVMLKSLEEIKKMLPMTDSINVPKLLKRHYKLLKATPIDVLSRVASNEREAVKDFILDSNFVATDNFSPHVIQSLVYSIETVINDN